MKRRVLILLSFVLIFSLICACSSSTLNGEEQATEVVSASSIESLDDTDVSPISSDVSMILTPYAYIKLPDDYQGNVVCGVVSEDPYTISFTVSHSGVLLYSIIFDGEGGRYLGSIETAFGMIDIYAEVPELNGSNAHDKTLVHYQEELSSIVDYWTAASGLMQKVTGESR